LVSRRSFLLGNFGRDVGSCSSVFAWRREIGGALLRASYRFHREVICNARGTFGVGLMLDHGGIEQLFGQPAALRRPQNVEPGIQCTFGQIDGTGIDLGIAWVRV
jgi:hypothetical protein